MDLRGMSYRPSSTKIYSSNYEPITLGVLGHRTYNIDGPLFIGLSIFTRQNRLRRRFGGSKLFTGLTLV